MLEAITPSDEFSETPITGKLTKAVYIAETALGTAFEAVSNHDSSNVTFVTGGQIIPIRINTALTITGFTVVYLY